MRIFQSIVGCFEVVITIFGLCIFGIKDLFPKIKSTPDQEESEMMLENK